MEMLQAQWIFKSSFHKGDSNLVSNNRKFKFGNDYTVMQLSPISIKTKK